MMMILLQNGLSSQCLAQQTLPGWMVELPPPNPQPKLQPILRGKKLICSFALFFFPGAPQVLRYSVSKNVEAVSGRDVRLEMEVCSDPIPTRTTWDMGHLRVEAGQEAQGRYLAEQVC